MDKRTCSVDGCDGSVLARGWCDMHYRRWKRTGDPLRTTKVVAYAPDAVCFALGCTERPAARGYCGRHYMRWRQYGDPLGGHDAVSVPHDAKCSVEGCDRRPGTSGLCKRHRRNQLHYGDPVPQKDRPLEVRLREVGWTITEAGCWEWDGKRNDNGYGLFSAKRFGYENARAHRVMYEVLVERIPDDLRLRHRCDNPPCVNPDHLIPGTAADNSRDMVERGRNSHMKRGATCANGHDMTRPGATKPVKRAGRIEDACVECARTRARRYMRRKRAA